MARIPIRHLFRIRCTILTHHYHCPPNLDSSKHHNLFSFSCSYSSSLPYIEDRPTSTYHTSIEFLRSCKTTRHLFQIQAQLTACGLFPFWSARLLKHSSDFGDIDYTILIFRCIDSPGTFVVNNVIKAYSVGSVPHQALVFYFEMLKNGFSPNSYTFVSLVGSCAKMGCVKSGRKCHGQAVKNGVDCISPVQNSLIHLYGCCGVMECARKVFDEMSQRDLVSWNSIIHGYASVGNLGLAHGLFDVMLERNIVTWNIMMNGYLKGNNPGCAMMLFRKLVESGLRGNDTTMVSLLTACGRSARLKEGRSVHGFLIRNCFKLSIILDTCLIDMYGKCQNVDAGQRIFDKMVNRNLVCWNAMILGHCIHGNPEDGLSLFAEMVDRPGPGNGEAILPDEVTYIGVLCACARAGLLTKGRNFFSQMVYRHGIKPNFAHYWCMANLYADSGLIQEAKDILRIMPEDEDASTESLVWANLLSLCRFQANATLGERIAKTLIDMEPWNFSHYHLLLNIYAAAGQWDDVARVKEMVKKRRMEKMPRCDLVDLKELVHEYKVGHYWPKGINEINMMISEMAE